MKTSQNLSRTISVSSLALLFLAGTLVVAAAPRNQANAPQNAPQGGPAGAPPAGAPGGQAGAPGGGGGRGGFNPFPTAAEMKGKLAGQVFKNVQALPTIPADQLLPSMMYITQALGVGCGFCHTPGQYDNDSKPEKLAARSMMRMVLSINGGTFDNQHMVTCYTCHRGSALPVTTPSVSMAAAPPAGPGGGRGNGGGQGGGGRGSAGGPGQGGGFGRGGENAQAAPTPDLPSVSDILTKYESALGGQAAIAKVTSRSETGTAQQGQGQPNQVEEVLKAPNLATSTTHGGRGDTMQGYDGSIGWSSNAFMGSSETTGDALVRLVDWAEFYPGLEMRRLYPRIEVDGIEQIDGHDNYRVLAYREADPDRFYFDKDTGLLTRFYTRIESFLGDMPQETTYEDYRAVNGVKFPYTVRVATLQNTTVYKWDKIDANASVDASRFAKPNIAPQGRGGFGAPGGGGPGGTPPNAPGGAAARPAGQ